MKQVFEIYPTSATDNPYRVVAESPGAALDWWANAPYWTLDKVKPLYKLVALFKVHEA